MIIAEEFISQKNKTIITPTGSARVLRMQFLVVVTERGGMNISWDEEMPPMYEDVPPSPPRYGNADPMADAASMATMSNYTGPALEYEDLERMTSENPDDPPRYREREDINVGLPMRTRVYASLDDPVEAGPSGTQPQRGRAGETRLTEDELGAEPPQYRLRRRSSPGEGPTEEDFGEGSAS